MEKVKCNHEYQTLPEGKYVVCIHCEKQVRMDIKEKPKKIIEILFDQNEEKVFIMVKPHTSVLDYEAMINIVKSGLANKVFLLPSDLVEEVKVIRDVGK